MVPLFGHLLVPVDLTDSNRPALDMALQLARQQKARVSLLHVVEGIEYADDEIRDFYAHLQQKARERIEPFAAPFQEAELKVTAEIVVGRPLREIVRCVNERAIDLIVLRSHRVDPEGPAGGWATLSYQVSVLCPCPVLLVK